MTRLNVDRLDKALQACHELSSCYDPNTGKHEKSIDEIMKNPQYFENNLQNYTLFGMMEQPGGNDPRNLITCLERKKKLDVDGIEQGQAITERQGFCYDLL